MKKILFFILLVVGTVSLSARQKIKVACIGNSITDGDGIKNALFDGYPNVLGEFLGDGYEVRNYGFSARTLMNSGDLPYMKEPMYKEALLFNPDIVTIKLGTNDSKPYNWAHKNDFEKDLTSLVQAFLNLPSHPKVFLCYPIPVTKIQWGINDSVIVNGELPIIKKVAKKMKLKTINLHKALKPYPQLLVDHVHPDEKGAEIIAKTIFKTITGKNAPERHRADFIGKKSSWQGSDRYDFGVYGCPATVLLPRQPITGRYWVWCSDSLSNNEQLAQQLLQQGYAVVFMDGIDDLGKKLDEHFLWKFYNSMHAFGLNSQVALYATGENTRVLQHFAINHNKQIVCMVLSVSEANQDNLQQVVKNRVPLLMTDVQKNLPVYVVPFLIYNR